MLKLDNITIAFGDHIVVKDLSYEFNEGETTAIMGASGSGKTTILNSIAGLLKVKKGNILNDHKKIGYIFQEPRLFPWMTALENVKTVCDDEEKARYYLDMIIPNAHSKYPHELSGGMKQRVSIARAMAYEPDLLLIDEPFKGLDETMSAQVKSIIYNYLNGRTALIVTHDRDDLDICHNVLSVSGDPISAFVVEKNDTNKPHIN